MPCDNRNILNPNDEFIDVLDHIEPIVTRSSCTFVLLCGDFNTSFDRQNAQTNFLSQYMERLSLICTWNHPNAAEGYTNTLTMT